jgi:hypothetical protein
MKRLLCILALVGIAVLLAGCSEKNLEMQVKEIKVVDKTTSLLQGTTFYKFTDGQGEYLTEWLTYRQIEIGHTYRFQAVEGALSSRWKLIGNVS